MRRRIFFLFASAALATACGLSAVGLLQEEPIDGGPSEAGVLPDGAPITDGEVPLGDAGDAGSKDSAVDANPANCVAGCDGGSCDGGTCVFSCGVNGCQGAPVVCPPGIPCAVECSGEGACNKGVDCAEDRKSVV